MVKLCVPGQARFFFPDEKPKIVATTNGFGSYEYEEHWG